MSARTGSVPRGLARGLALFLAAALAVACSHAIPLKPTVERPQGVVQAPAVLGVHYTRDFKEYRHSDWRGGDRWDFDLGRASVELFDKALPALFEGVVPVASRPPLAPGGPKVAAVLEPRIESFDFSLPFLKTGTYTAEITYRLTLYSPQGAQIVSWTVRGAGAKPGQMGFEFARWPGEAADLAMQEAVTRLMTGFREVPEVRGWLRGLGAPGAWWVPRWLRVALGLEE